MLQAPEARVADLQLCLDDVEVIVVALLNDEHVICEYYATLVEPAERFEPGEELMGEILLDEPHLLAAVLDLCSEGEFAGVVGVDDLVVFQELVVAEGVLKHLLMGFGSRLYHAVIN